MRTFLLLVLVQAFFGASAQVVDQAGRTVLVPSNPQRIASVFGVATPYLYPFLPPETIVAARYLGIPDHPLSDGVMRRVDPAYRAKALGGDVSAEELVAKGVELVFAGLRHQDLAAVLAEIGIPTVLIGPETFEAVEEATRIIGTALGRGERAEALVGFYREILARIAQGTADIPEGEKPRVLVVGSAAHRVASGAMYQSRMVELAGGIPVTKDLPGSWQNVNIEQIILWNPKVVVIVPYSIVRPEDLLNDPLWASVEAVRRGRVYKMPQLLFAWDTPIPESVLGILWLAELFHPGRVALDFAETALSFYREFYRCELKPEELDALLGG